ncbi:unnamed protein product [marine sediment metagenome]|uniref:Ribonucleotide reductase large subunit C-terminal domain-containing protein n=1 Tax=marine sediment metagenome TaxID=412755 RepID=X1BH89_9ZZZZ
MRLISDATWKTGDPGLQFHDLINEMNCCKSDECVATNPCAEYLAQNETSCNLSSVNLMKFYDQEKGIFMIDDFVHVCWIMSTAMDVWIDEASYPTEKIEKATKTFRTIGLGYTNLGSLIMSAGWAYDSDAAREAASAITSLMTAIAYRRSTNHCSFLPPFSKWEENKKSMIEVLKTHLSSSKEIEKIHSTHKL